MMKTWLRAWRHFKAGRVSPIEFNGACGLLRLHAMKGARVSLMLRIKFPVGIISPPTLRCVVNLLKKFCVLELNHLSTRQVPELCDLCPEFLKEVFQRLEAAGLKAWASGEIRYG